MMLLKALAVWVLALALGFFAGSGYLVQMATATAILALWGQSWNLFSGLSGNISLGHSAFVATAVYITLVLFVRWGVPPLWGGFCGVGAAVALAALIGAATLRLHGPSFSLATLAAAAVVLALILHYPDLTGGASGVALAFTHNAALSLEFTDGRVYYAIAVTLLFATTLLVRWVRQSRLGYYIAAIKSSEQTAAAAGVHVARVKVAAFCLSAGLTAVGSVVYVFYLGFADPNYLAGLTLSIEIALVAFLGGADFLLGPLVGAIFFELIDTGANALVGASGGWDMMVLGFAVVAAVMIEPRGLCAMAVRGWEALRCAFGYGGKTLAPV